MRTKNKDQIKIILILNMIGFSVMIVPKLWKRKNNIMSAINAVNICYAKTVLVSLFISIKWKQPSYQLVMAPLHLRKLKELSANWNHVKVVVKNYQNIWNIMNIMRVQRWSIFYAKDAMINQLYKSRKNFMKCNHSSWTMIKCCKSIHNR